MRVISYGGGVQSSALIVLAATGKIDKVDAAIFSNVGDDSEHPETLSYVREIMAPWALERGIQVHELHRTLKDGSTQTLWQRMMDHEGDTLREPIPVFGYSGAPMSRSCTADHKIKVLGKWIKANCPELPASVLIGISTDEYQRANRGKNEKWETREYPLLDLGLSRNDCVQVIKNAGLPVPPKSSCFYCPFHNMQTWAELKRDSPDLFDKAQQLEDKLNERRKNRNKPPVYLTRKNNRLSLVVHEAGPTLFEPFNDGKCDEGACWT
jgi:hypothetical protein